MPASQRSLRVTELYRQRVFGIRDRLERQAWDRWPTIDDDFDPWLAATAAATAGAQRDAIRATSGFLAAYLTSELGRRVQPPPLEADRYVGLARDGRPLTRSLNAPLIGLRAGLSAGLPAEEVLRAGLPRAVRQVGVDFDHSHRQALLDGMEADKRIEGWQRAVRGTCGACVGDIAIEVSVNLPSVPLLVHPYCQCVTVPVVTGTRNLVPLPTGQQLFERMSRQEQDDALGPGPAEQVRNGETSLADLVAESEIDTAQNFITQAPVGAP